MALIDLDGRWRQVNRALCTMLRYTEAELMRLNRADIVHPDDLPPASSLEPGDTDPADMEIRMLDALGGIVWTEVSRSIVRDETGAPLYYIAQIQDITERREFSVKLAHMADHDVLTGLFNRRRFEQELDRQVAYTERYATPATLLMLDLDNFKYVNDTLGHAMGDELLVRVARGPARAPAHHRRDHPSRRRRVRDHPARDRHRRRAARGRVTARDDQGRRPRPARELRDPGDRQHRHRGDRDGRSRYTERADDARRRRDV